MKVFVTLETNTTDIYGILQTIYEAERMSVIHICMD